MSTAFRHIGTDYLCAPRLRLFSNSFHTSLAHNNNASSSATSLPYLIRDLVPNGKSLRKMRKDIAGPSVVENSKLKQHLDYIEATKERLVLEDVERHRPNEQVDFRLPEYDQKYREIRNALIQSFTKPQLRKFLHLYGLRAPPASKGKDIFAELVMEKWGWEPLAKVQQERGDRTQTSELLHPLSPGSAFLFMGRDGADLLNLTQQYNVHLSFNSDPLSLKVQGLRGDVKRMDARIKDFEEDIALETTHLPLGLRISPQIAQSISRLSGTYVETRDDEKLSITYRKSKPEALEHVMRLAVQAASEQLDQNSSFVEWLTEKAETSFSFYPFFPSQIASRKLEDGSSFRVRRVGQWLRAGARYNMDGEELPELTLSRQPEVDFEGRLLDEISTMPLPNSSRVVTASTGHFLFLTSSGQATFVPPIKGNVGPEAVLQWAKDHLTHVVFNPSVPRSCMLLWPHLQKQLTRIVYKARHENNEKRKRLTLEIIDSPAAPNSDPSSSVLEPHSENVLCHRSVETHVDILLPSRTTDIRVSAANVENIPPSNIPQELRSLIEMTKLTVETWADIPLTLNLDGLDYILSSTSKIQQDHHKMSGTLLGKPVQYEVVVETTLDSEVGQHAGVCKIIFHNPDQLNGFLEHCDHLTMIDDNSTSEHPLAMIKPWFDSKRGV